jgi:hypothetical protein
VWIETGSRRETHRRWTPEVRPPPDELSVAFADEVSPVSDEYVPGILLELREHVGALIARVLSPVRLATMDWPQSRAGEDLSRN